MMKHKRKKKLAHEPIGRVKIIEDFLPPRFYEMNFAIFKIKRIIKKGK